MDGWSWDRQSDSLAGPGEEDQEEVEEEKKRG